ncbi:CrcB protein [Glaciihabitans tibetensis]|uniref:Fluoride-specific ion channel FluC n=1 Tax=Glaciihabitans tibetensis TaxID=1266600 RepID=A0A2T0VDB3_9MICO|nr:CrcB family protein [Glaciihabitans tibetensis]PRY68158.1 CrcB protein [Glaciihabitans tibetensis]
MTSLAKSVAAVFVGGVLGTSARLGLDYVIPHGDDDFPVSTLLINVVGSALLGLLVAGIGPDARGWLRAGLGPGLLGSFTTFSAVMVSLVSLTAGNQFGSALLYLVMSVMLGFAAALLGLRVGHRAVQRRGEQP